MKKIKFLLQKIVGLLLFGGGIVLLVWLVWTLLRQLEIKPFPKGEVIPKSMLPTVRLSHLPGEGGADGKVHLSEKVSEEERKSARPDVSQKFLAGNEKNNSFPGSETSSERGTNPHKENRVTVTQNELSINGKLVLSDELLEYLRRVDTKTKVYFFQDSGSEICELIRTIKNKHVSTVIVP